MKKSIHPKWNHQAVVTCACGNTFETGSTLDTIQLDICSACHPFYTGSMKFVDTQGRVERFMKMRSAAQTTAGKKKKGDKKDAPKAESKTLKEMLADEKSKLAAAESSENVV